MAAPAAGAEMPTAGAEGVGATSSYIAQTAAEASRVGVNHHRGRREASQDNLVSTVTATSAPSVSAEYHAAHSGIILALRVNPR
jgi:hypothetical protein